MLISSENVLIDTPKRIFVQMSGRLIIQTSCHIKFTIIPPKLQPLQKKMFFLFFFLFYTLWRNRHQTEVSQLCPLPDETCKKRERWVCAHACVCACTHACVQTTAFCAAFHPCLQCTQPPDERLGQAMAHDRGCTFMAASPTLDVLAFPVS